MSDLVFQPVLPWPWLAAAAAIVVALIGWSFWTGLKSKRRLALLAAIRLLATAGIVFALLQPQEQKQEVTILRPQIAVLVDNSLSMNDPVDNTQPHRSERVKDFFDSTATQQARKSYDVRAFDLGQAELSADKPPADFTANTSNILGAVGQLVDHFKGQPLAAVLLLSDGLDTSGFARPETASFHVPVDTFELEKPFTPRPPEQRISIASADFPPRAVVGWHSEIHVSIAGSGVSGKVVPVELWLAGRKVGDATTAFNQDEQTRQVTFEFTHEQPGLEQFEIRVKDAAADKEARSYPFSIRVSEPGKRVLYVQNQLSFDYKFLRQAIVSNRDLQLSSFTRWADGRIVNLDDRAGPAQRLDFSPGALANDAVIILGDLAPDALPAQDWKNLRDYVDRGGGLILLGGPASYPDPRMGQTALADALPVKPPAAFKEGSFTVQITATGLHHPAFGPVFAQVEKFPPLLTVNAGGALAPIAEVLMQASVDGKEVPLVAAVRFGKGRVVSVMSDSVWRWRLGAAQWRQDSSPFELFWTQLLDWLAPKEETQGAGNSIEMFTERSSYVQGEEPEIRAIVQSGGNALPATLPLRLHTPDGRTLEYTLKPAVFQSRDGRSVHGYSAAIEPNVTGIFRAETSARLGGGSVNGEMRFVVTRPATEITGKPINRDFLQKLAAATKGAYYSSGDWNNWIKDLHVQEQHSIRLELSDLWNRPVLLGLIMCLLAAEWIARKAWHLP
jgi:uncharacterized membrane protein